MNTILSVKKGEKGSLEKLVKYYKDGTLNAETYAALTDEYYTAHQNRVIEKKRRIKNTITGIAASIVVFSSLLFALAFIIPLHGKGPASIYLVLWLLAIYSFVRSN